MFSPNPFLVLEVPEEADDAAVRSAYLDLVRRFPPDSQPERFQAIAQAYEAIKAPDKRAQLLLFGHIPPAGETLRSLAPDAPNRRQPVGSDRWLKLLAEAHHGL